MFFKRNIFCSLAFKFKGQTKIGFNFSLPFLVLKLGVNAHTCGCSFSVVT